MTPSGGGGGGSSSGISRRPGSPGSPTLPLLGPGSGPILARRGILSLPYAVLVLAAIFLLVNLASHSAVPHRGTGGGDDGPSPAGPDGAGLMLASNWTVAAPGPASTACDCTGEQGQGVCCVLSCGL
jgi:hypothetical protein